MTFKNTKSAPGVFAHDTSDEIQARLAALPPGAKENYAHLEKLAFESRGRNLANLERLAELRDKHDEAQAQASHLERSRDRGGMTLTDADEKRLRAFKKVVDETKSAMRAIREEKQEPTLNIESINDFIGAQPRNRVFRDFLPDVKLKKGQTAKNAFDDCRAAITEAQAQIKTAQRAPVTNDEATSVAMREISEMAGQGAPEIYSSGRIKWPTEQVRDASGYGREVQMGTAFAIWLFRDQVEARVKKMLAAKKRDGALSAEERAAKIATLRALILKLEREEEVLIRLCEASGFVALRRPNANPLAVLGIVADDSARQKEPETPPPDYPVSNELAVN